MKVLTIYAHNPHSFCHGVLHRFTDGLRDGGHTREVVDLHAIKFDWYSGIGTPRATSGATSPTTSSTSWTCGAR